MAGTIDRRSSGRYRLRVRVHGERKTFTFDSLEEAEACRRDILATLEGRSRPTVRSWGGSWLDRRDADPAFRDSKGTRGIWQRYLLSDPIADRELVTLKPRDVRRWVARVRDRGLSRQTVRNALHALSAALRDAVEDGVLDVNPALGIRVPKEARTADEWTFLSQEEIDAVLGCAAIPRRSRLAFALAIFTGLRAGELWGLRWSEVGPGELVVRYGDGQGRPTKGGQPRTVPMLPPARAAFEELRRGPRAISGHVFFSGPAKGARRVGGAPHTRGYDAGWAKRWRSVAGIRPGVRFHDFRHTFASHLVMGTWGRPWRLEEVRTALGHQSVTTTERYAHLAPSGMERARREAEEAWKT